MSSLVAGRRGRRLPPPGPPCVTSCVGHCAEDHDSIMPMGGGAHGHSGLRATLASCWPNAGIVALLVVTMVVVIVGPTLMEMAEQRVGHFAGLWCSIQTLSSTGCRVPGLSWPRLVRPLWGESRPAAYGIALGRADVRLPPKLPAPA